MASQLAASLVLSPNAASLPLAHPLSGKWKLSQFAIGKCSSLYLGTEPRNYKLRATILRPNCCAKMESLNTNNNGESKLVWIWTDKKQVMTAAVERGWNTFIFDAESLQLAKDWSSIALINPLYLKDGVLTDSESRSVASFSEVSSPQQLDQMFLEDKLDNIVISLLDWQVIPAENIVAALQGHNKRAFAVAETASEAQTFLEALEHGLGGVVLKVDNPDAVLKLKVGSYARGLFLVHSECLETDYIASRPFRVNAGPVHSYVAIPGGKTCYLSELKAGKEVIVVDHNGQQRTAIVGRVKIETRPLVLVEAKGTASDQSFYSILLQNAETVALVAPNEGHGTKSTAIPVTSIKPGDEVLLRVQGGARHTGIEIHEFIVEK